MDDANKKAIYGIGAAILIGTLASGIYYLATERQNYVAKVDGTRITTEEFGQAMERFKNSPMGKMQPEEMAKNGIIGQLIDRQLIMAEVANRRVSTDAASEAAKYEEIRKPYMDPQNPANDERFTKVLEANHLTAAELKKGIHERMTVEALGKDLAKANPVTENEVRQYFDKHQQAFQTAEEVRASHILVKEESKAKELVAKLKDGADFAKVAKENSIDGSKEQGGDLGFFGRGRMVPEFETAAFALKPGQMSGIVKSQFGFHIIKCTDHHPAVTKTFEQVKDDAKQRLTQEREAEALQKWVTEARKNAKIEYKEGFAPPPTPAPALAPVNPGASTSTGAKDTGKPAETPQNSTKAHAPSPAPSK